VVDGPRLFYELKFRFENAKAISYACAHSSLFFCINLRTRRKKTLLIEAYNGSALLYLQNSHSLKIKSVALFHARKDLKIKYLLKNVDANECQGNPDVCPSDSTCVNTFGSYMCNCSDGLYMNEAGSACLGGFEFLLNYDILDVILKMQNHLQFRWTLFCFFLYSFMSRTGTQELKNEVFTFFLFCFPNLSFFKWNIYIIQVQNVFALFSSLDIIMKISKNDIIMRISEPHVDI